MYNLIAFAFAAAFFASSSFAAPRAESAQECGIAADMAVVAQSLAREDIHRPKAGAIMARIYEVSESERGKALMKEILDAAYTTNAAAGGSADANAAQKFAEELFVACMKNGGDMDTILGRRL
jgi:lipopolysaccharide export LptBFGC system permease protein LptF